MRNRAAARPGGARLPGAAMTPGRGAGGSNRRAAPQDRPAIVRAGKGGYP